MTDEKKKDNKEKKDDKDAKKIDDEQLKDVAGGSNIRTNTREDVLILDRRGIHRQDGLGSGPADDGGVQ